MKALVIQQPYAGLVVLGVKGWELRLQRTNHRGPLAIVAGRQPLADAGTMALDIPALHGGNLCGVVGCAIGVVEVVDCVQATAATHGWVVGYDWARINAKGRKLWAWQLERPKRIRPELVRGRQGIFNIEIKEVPWHEKK